MRRESFDEARISALLEDLGGRVEFPATPDLTTRVTDVLSAEDPSPRLGEVRRPWFARPAFAIPVLIAAVLAASLVLSAPARRAIADLLGVVGIRIEFGAPDERATPHARATEPDLGERTSLETAAATVGFEIVGPRAIDEEYEIYLDRGVGSGGMVSTVFRSGGGSIAYLVSEFEAQVSADFIKKVVPAGDVSVRYPTIAGGQAYWIEGAPHFFSYLDADGVVREETVRLARNVLLWSSGGVTYRIEGPESLRRALELAGNMGF